MRSVALVAGSSRGIGFEVARQLAARDCSVIVTSRSKDTATAAAEKIGSAAVGHELDTSDEGSIMTFANWLIREIGRLDILINNAAILLDENGSILGTSAETFETTDFIGTRNPLINSAKFSNVKD